MKYLFISLFASLLLFSACKSRGLKAQASPAAQDNDLPFEVVSEGAYSASAQESQQLITNQEAWEAAWATMHAQQQPQPERPAIDFSQDWLILCYMGAQPSGGYQVKVDAIERTSAGLDVQLHYQEPGQGCFTTMALTQPYVLVKIPKQPTQRITYHTKTQKVDC